MNEERGHRRKIRAAIEALDAQGMLPPYLRPVARDALVFAELVRQGYRNDMPTRHSISREFARMGRDARTARTEQCGAVRNSA
jgi:hypothetical protein